MTASSLHCPGCGAPAASDAAGCGYCGSALATANCPSCFAPNAVGARFCARCGAAMVRSVDDDAAPLPCPRCAETMAALTLSDVGVRECGACGGLWLDPATLQRLCDAREQHTAIVGLLAGRAPSTGAAADTVRYVPCPECHRLMNRVNFARSSGIIMDVCRPHGVWLDRGELERVVGFVDAGGLAVARTHDRMQAAEEERLRVLQRDLTPRVASDTAPVAVYRETVTGSRELSVDALGRLLLEALGLVQRS